MVDRVIVVGGGVIGLACAWSLAQAGQAVRLIAPSPGRDGASWVAAGMLAPVTEVQFGEAALTSLLLEGLSRWSAFAADLEAATGRQIGFDQSGTLAVALDPSDRAALGDLLAYQHSLGCQAERLAASACRTAVPALSPAVCGGIEVPGDYQVDNRALLDGLMTACRDYGVEFVSDTVLAVTGGPAVVLSDGSLLGGSGEAILLAAGVGVAGIGGLEGAGLPEVRPVKGHIVRLGTPAPTSAPLLARTVRALVHGRAIYLVPRQDGSVVVGATMEEMGADTTVRAGAVHQLLDDARAVIPAIDELTLLEAQAGLRPATPDNMPCIRWTDLPGVAVATGHFRNGILLAPHTAQAVTVLMADDG